VAPQVEQEGRFSRRCFFQEGAQSEQGSGPTVTLTAGSLQGAYRLRRLWQERHSRSVSLVVWQQR
jgi:hypothetical protein